MSPLPAAARAYIGVAFGHQGRNPRVAIDCIGLLVLACRDVGWWHYADQDYTGYSRHPHQGLLEQHLDRIFGPPVCLRPNLADLHYGDVVALRYGGPVRHVGIVGEQDYGGKTLPTLIHTDSQLGRVTEHRIDAAWLEKIVRVYRPEAPDVR